MGLLSLLKRGTRWDSLADLPVIETKRLRVAALVPEDADDLRRLTDDPAVTGAVDFLPETFTLADARGLIRSTRGGRDVFLGARAWMTGDLVAVVGTHMRALQSIEIGYWVGGAARGRGYGAEAVGAVVGTLAHRFARRAVVAECRPENHASWQMLHKLGFRPTGDEGHRPGRKILVWDIREAPRARPAALLPRRAGAPRPAGGEGQPL